MEPDDQPQIRVAIGPYGITLQVTQGDNTTQIAMSASEAIRLAGMIQAHATIRLFNEYVEQMEQAEREAQLRATILNPGSFPKT